MTDIMEQAIYVPDRRLEGKWCDKIIEEFEYRLENFPSTSVIWNSGDDFGPVERKDKATFLDSLYSADVGMDLRNSMTLLLQIRQVLLQQMVRRQLR
jgi:hypothetical protein